MHETATIPTSSPTAPLERLAHVRSKNAGPFWLTLDIFFDTSPDFERITRSEALAPRVISELYQVPEDSVRSFELPDLQVIKISLPRPVAAGSFADRDLHAGQQHIPLARLLVPAADPSPT